MRRSRNKKSQAVFVWVFALMFLFMISLVYIVMTKPFIAVRDIIGPNFTGTEFEPTFDKINTFWVVWPILLIVSVLIWAFLSTLRDRPDFPRL